jgi:hypothetical protein
LIFFLFIYSIVFFFSETKGQEHGIRSLHSHLQTLVNNSNASIGSALQDFELKSKATEPKIPRYVTQFSHRIDARQFGTKVGRSSRLTLVREVARSNPRNPSNISHPPTTVILSMPNVKVYLSPMIYNTCTAYQLGSKMKTCSRTKLNRKDLYLSYKLLGCI